MTSKEVDKNVVSKKERRSSKREMTLGSHLYLYPHPNKRLEKIDAITSDISKTGISIYVCKKLDVGSIFTIDSKIHGSSISKGKVVWCTQVEDTIYKIGLSLL